MTGEFNLKARNMKKKKNNSRKKNESESTEIR